MENMKLSPPWVTFANEVKALFEQDKEVVVLYYDERKKLELYVKNERKADAISQLIPSEKTFGNVTIKINVVTMNQTIEDSRLNLIKAAFAGNKAVEAIRDVDTPFGTMHYVIFEASVVQFPNDDTQDINGMKSTLYQDIAREIIGQKDNVLFCTDRVRFDTRIPF